MESVSLRGPEKIGAKVRLMLQVAPAAMVAVLHALKEFRKSVGLFPPATMLEICSGALPALVMVTLMGVLASPWVMMGKLTVVGVIRTDGATVGEAMPVPVRARTCGLPAALSVNVRVA